MNKRTIALLAGLLIVLIILWAVGRGHKAMPSASTREHLAAVSGAAPSYKVPGIATVQPSREDALTPDEKQQRYLEKARSAGMQLNRPAKFYGCIVDQNNQPVVGEVVKCGLSYFGDRVLPGLKPHYDEFDRITDSFGRFNIEAKEGLALDLKLHALEGYEFSPVALTVTLRDISPNLPAPSLSTPEHPYVFRAYKRKEAAVLTKGGVACYDCIPDGRYYIVNLKNNRISEVATMGSFKISIKRPPGDSPKVNYGWSVKIDAVDMELLEANDVFMYDAPASGYQRSWEYIQLAESKKYIREISRKFYIKSLDGSAFGRVEIDIMSDYRNVSGFIVDYWLNLGGSRNLE